MPHQGRGLPEGPRLRLRRPGGLPMTRGDRHKWRPVGAIVGLSFVAASCSSGSSARAAAQAACRAQRPSPVGYLADDISATGRSDAIATERRRAISAFLTQLASCSGHAKVVAFTSSAAATRTLLDQDLIPGGATDIARRRRIPKLIEAAMQTVDMELNAPGPTCRVTAPTSWRNCSWPPSTSPRSEPAGRWWSES